MKGGWIIPAGSFLKKIMHIYESSSMMLGPLLAVSSWQRGIFPFGSEWSQPSSHYFTRLSSHHFSPPPPPNSLSESWYLGSLAAQKGPNIFFPTTWPLSLKSWSASTLDHLTPLLSLPFLSPLYPSMDIFILRMLDVWASVGNGTFIVPQWWKWSLSSGLQ